MTYVIILFTLAMRVGTRINEDQLRYARSIHKRIGTYEMGLQQFLDAVKDCRDKSYHFEERSLPDAMQPLMASIRESSMLRA